MNLQKSVSSGSNDSRGHENVATHGPLAPDVAVDVIPKPGGLQGNAVHQQTVLPSGSEAANATGFADVKVHPYRQLHSLWGAFP